MNTTTKADRGDRKKLLYIDVEQYTPSMSNATVMTRSSKFFSTFMDLVVMSNGPDDAAVEVVRRAVESGDPFDLIVTNVPVRRASAGSYDSHDLPLPSRCFYEQSLNAIERMKRICDIPVLAFTGASSSSRLMFIDTGYVDDAVWTNTDEEFKKQMLDLTESYKRLPPPASSFEIVEKEGYLVCAMRIRINSPIPSVVAGALVRYAKQLKITLSVTYEGGEMDLANSTARFNCQAPCKVGSSVEVSVSRNDSIAHKYLHDACVALDARYAFEIPWLVELNNGSSAPG